MRVGSLFSGIGLGDLGLEAAGMEIVFQVEIEAFASKILERRWPNVGRRKNIKRVKGSVMLREYGPVDLLAGGFPCQDISSAGRGAGITGKRSGLWKEFARLIREIRPRYVLVENVPALLGRGLGVVLADLAASGYDAEWDCISASALGAPHQRDRVWVVAYPMRGDGSAEPRFEQSERSDLIGSGGAGNVAYPDSPRQQQPERVLTDERRRSGDSGQELADSEGERRHDGLSADERSINREGDAPRDRREILADSASQLGQRPRISRTGRSGFTDGGEVGDSERSGFNRKPWGGARTVFANRRPSGEQGWWWATEPDVGRVAHGVPSRVDRLKGLGNGWVVQNAIYAGRCILEFDGRR